MCSNRGARGFRYICQLMQERQRSEAYLAEDQRLSHRAHKPRRKQENRRTRKRVQCASSFTRVWFVIQFTSHVLPPSSEYACSKWGVPVVMFVQRNRTSTDLPF